MEEINRVLAENLQVSLEDVSKNLKMEDVDHWDSLSHMNLIVALENVLKIELSGDDIAEMTTFDSVRAIVAKYI